ncbi:hypothetical protein L4C38_15165 [Vibrio kasasachensis]|uniref:hypothetical protein n=1 Tax=Vibrio kasasachensis TaxID=2910248 RepID=UPI003D10505D
MVNWRGFNSILIYTVGVVPSVSALEMVIPIDVDIVGKRVEITGYLDDEREQYWALEGNELIPALALSVDATRLDALRGILQDRKATKADFTQVGWHTEYNIDELLISIVIPVNERKLIEIPFEPASNTAPPANLPHVKPALFSGALNTYWSHTRNLVETDYSISQVATRTTAAFGAITFEDGHTYSYNHFNHRGNWLRDSSRLMANLPNRMGFVQFGDYRIKTDISPLPSGDLFGLSYSYQPEYIENSLKPNIVPISLESTSLVTVRINGEDYRTIRLAAGQYNLRDLPLEQGVNEVEVSYIDQSGIEQKRFFNLVDHPQLLLQGDIETQWVYGAEQIYSDNGDKRIETDRINTQGVISYGLTNWWTLSSSFLLEQDSQHYSIDQSFALGDFFITFDGELNELEDSRSYSLQSQFYASELLDDNLSSFSLRYGVNKASEITPLSHTIALSSGVKTPVETGYLSFNIEHQFNDQGTMKQSASINTSYRVNELVTTSLNLRWQRYNNSIDRSLYLTVSLPLRWNDVSISTRTAYDSRNDEYQSELSASQYKPEYYWRAATKYKDKQYDGFDGYGKWYGERVTWNGRYSSRNLSQQTSSRTLSIGADTALAWAGNNLIWTSPVSSSFNIVSLPEELTDKYALKYDQYRRIQIVPADEGGQNQLMVPVKNDGHRTIKVGGDNLEFNEELKQGEFVAFGGLYNGSAHQLSVDKGYFVSGFFHNQNRDPMADIVGEFRDKHSKHTYPFFTDEMGNFELDVLPEGNYQVYFYDNVAQAVDIQISQQQVSDEVFIDLGVVPVSAN